MRSSDVLPVRAAPAATPVELASAPAPTEGGPRLLKGAPLAARVRGEVRDQVAAFRRRFGYAPALAIVLAGRDAPSTVYLDQILRTCQVSGIAGRPVDIGDRISNARLRRVIGDLNDDPLVAGIIVQMPLPKHIELRAVFDAIDPAKDIDGIHPLNVGLMSLGYRGFLPATAQAAVALLKFYEVPLEGSRVTVVGRSNVIGKPVSLLLQREDATVIMCHSRTRDLARHLRDAEVVVVAAGRPGLVTGDMLARGAVVVDVGINVVDGRLVGDVDFASVRDVVSAITPVPGGVGAVTNALLMAHLMQAAWAQTAAAHTAHAPRSSPARTHPKER